MCAVIVEVLLPTYIRVMKLRLWRDSRMVWMFHDVQEWLMEPTFLLSLQKSALPIIAIVKVGIPSSYREWSTTLDDLRKCTLGGQEEHRMLVFINSSLYKRGLKGTLFSNWKETISGKEIPLLVLGDPAYPLLSWLMKAFPDNSSLSCQQKTFNYCLSRARTVVEHVYGRLKGQWRCLLKRNVFIRDLPKLVATCCVLHNVCEIHGETFDEEWMSDIADHDSVNTVSRASTSPE